MQYYSIGTQDEHEIGRNCVMSPLIPIENGKTTNPLTSQAIVLQDGSDIAK